MLLLPVIGFANPAATDLVSKIVPITSPVPSWKANRSALALSTNASNETNYTRNKLDFFLTDSIKNHPKRFYTTTFNCVGSIYGVVEFSKFDHELRNKKLTIEWVNPDRNVELSSHRLTYQEQGSKAFRWGGMTLSRPTAGSIFSAFDPIAGMERFIGPWRVRVLIDNKVVVDEGFEVRC